MQCQKCNATNPDNYAFCQQCGDPLNKSYQNTLHIVTPGAQEPKIQDNATSADPFLSNQNLSRYWYCPRDHTKMKNVQHKYINNPIFWVSRNNAENSVQNAVGVYKIPQYAVQQTLGLAKAIFDHSTLEDIELVGVQCPICKLGAAAPKIPRVESLDANFGSLLYHETTQQEQLQNIPYYSDNQPLTPNTLLWLVILFFGFIGFIFFIVSLSFNPTTELFNLLIGTIIGLLLLFTAYGLYKINDNFRILALIILGIFGFLMLINFDLIILIFVIFPGYVLGFDRVTVFLFKEQSRRKQMIKN